MATKMTREQKEKIADLVTSWYTIIPEDNFTNGEIMFAVSMLIADILLGLDNEDEVDEAISDIMKDAQVHPLTVGIKFTALFELPQTKPCVMCVH